MRHATTTTTCLLALSLLAGCDLIEAATAEKPTNAQLNAVGDLFAQVGTLADVVNEPATATNGDLAGMMRFEHFARIVAPSSRKPLLRALRAAELPGCIATSGDDRVFGGCDVVLDDGRACVVSGAVTRTPSGSGNRYAGSLTLGAGAASCPTATLDVDVYLEGPTDNPTRASGSVVFELDDPSGEALSGSATIDDLAVTGTCTVPSSGQLTVTVDGAAGGTITLSFHDSPGCGIVYIE